MTYKYVYQTDLCLLGHKTCHIASTYWILSYITFTFSARLCVCESNCGSFLPGFVKINWRLLNFHQAEWASGNVYTTHLSRNGKSNLWRFLDASTSGKVGFTPPRLAISAYSCQAFEISEWINFEWLILRGKK